jgi:antitoxin Phd
MRVLKPNYITNEKGVPTSVILTVREYDRLVEYIEELEDIAAYDRAKTIKGKSIPWDQVKRSHV